MVQTISSIFNKFFIKLEPARTGIFWSSGLIVIYFWISASGFFHKLNTNHLDRRQKSKIRYSLFEIIQFIILHILDGDKRISHYDRNPNQYLFLRLFKWVRVPNQSTVLKALKSNPALSRILNHFLLKSCIDETVIEELKNDFSSGLAHCDDFAVNSIMTTCTGIAYNIKNKILDTGVLDESISRRRKLSTLQSIWLHTPGEFVKASNRYKLKNAPERFNLFKKVLTA